MALSGIDKMQTTTLRRDGAMSDPDGIWRFHVMPCQGGWKVVQAGRIRSVHLKKGAAMSAAKRAYKFHPRKASAQASLVTRKAGRR